MGRHRKQRRPRRRPGPSPHRRVRARHRAGRRVALLTIGVLLPCAGGAAVLAASTRLEERAAPSAGVHRSAEHPTAPVHAPAAARPKAATRPSASGTPAAARPAPATTRSAAALPPVAFSPYADVLTWPPLDLAKTAARTHVKDYTLGFVAAGTGCTAAWGGMTALDDAVVRHLIQQVPGTLTVSFGGPHGVEPAERCRTGELAARYAAVLAATHADRFDFYLTETELADGAATARRTQALAQLQHDHPGLRISFTLPVRRSGLSADALSALSSAADAGLEVSTVDLAPPAGTASAVIASATAANSQLQRLYRQNAPSVWRRMSIAPVIGVGASGAGLRPAGARGLRDWAAETGLGGLSMWSLTRDAPCAADTSVLDDTCSGLDEKAGGFAAILGGS